MPKLIAKTGRHREEQQERSRAGEPIFLASDAHHGLGFFSLFWNGESYTFSPVQAAIVAILWRAAEAGTPEVHVAALLVEAGSEMQKASLAPLFSRNPAWKTLIVFGERKGTYRLDPKAKKKKRKNPRC